jgi:hypothetical protein
MKQPLTGKGHKVNDEDRRERKRGWQAPPFDFGAVSFSFVILTTTSGKHD